MCYVPADAASGKSRRIRRWTDICSRSEVGAWLKEALTECAQLHHSLFRVGVA